MSSKFGVLLKLCAVFDVWVHGAVEWGRKDFEGGVEACMNCGCEAVWDGPLIGYFGYYALWVELLGAWVVSLHELC